MNILESDAFFSDCGKYRWWLKRRFSQRNRTLVFVGLNPSTGNKLENDMTLRRLMSFCFAWDYDCLVVVNLFAIISSSPANLIRLNNPIGRYNNQQLINFACNWSQLPSWDLWFGWGVGGTLLNRNREVFSLLKPFIAKRNTQFPDSLGPLCIGHTKGGHPRHPLYVSREKFLSPFYSF